VVHPAAGHFTGTLVNALLHLCPNLKGIGGEQRPGIVHRLDKDTSGAIVVAKTDRAMMRLTVQFRRRTVRKEYVALVRGYPVPSEQRVETLIGRNRHDRKRMSAQPTGRGRTAITHLRVVRKIGDVSLVRLRIETGETRRPPLPTSDAARRDHLLHTPGHRMRRFVQGAVPAGFQVRPGGIGRRISVIVVMASVQSARQVVRSASESVRMKRSK
jgi:hypothetical protein